MDRQLFQSTTLASLHNQWALGCIYIVVDAGIIYLILFLLSFVLLVNCKLYRHWKEKFEVSFLRLSRILFKSEDMFFFVCKLYCHPFSCG